MIQDIYDFFPYFANGMVALSLLFRLHKRSISAFIIFVAIAICSNLAYYGYLECGVFLMVIVMIVIMIRAMFKVENDSLFIKRNEKRRRSDGLCDEQCVADLIREMKEQEC